MKIAAIALLALVVTSFVATSPAVAEATQIARGSETPEPPTITTVAVDDEFRTGGSRASTNDSTSRPANSRPVYETARIPQRSCGSLDGLARSPIPCIDGVEGGAIIRTCTDGTRALDPLFRRPVDADGNDTGPWEQVDNGGCTEDPPVAVILTAADFSRLPLTPSAPLIQPADGHGLVNADLIVYTDPTPQTLTTTVLGIPVTVRATPTTYTWDYGDGTPPLVTADPGQPYPHHTVARPYTAPGDYQLTLSTTWTGTYQINNAGPWLDVLGTATTTSTPQATHITEAHTILTTNP